jgi:hypothetical protein
MLAVTNGAGLLPRDELLLGAIRKLTAAVAVLWRSARASRTKIRVSAVSPAWLRIHEHEQAKRLV